MWRWRRFFFVLAVLGVIAVSAAGYVIWQTPLPAAEPPLLQTTFVCAADVTSDCNRDNSIAQLSGGVDRVNVDYEQIPAIFIQALVSAEDREFFDHEGVDPFAIGRAVWADVSDDGLRQGGSTITQQYVKNAYLTSDRTLERKLKEAVLAVKLEQELPKQEILERYLNTIYFGRGAYGIEAASLVYFGKHVQDLGLAESAYLAGIIRAPESADANRALEDPLRAQQIEVARVRRGQVLDAMLEEGYITQQARDAVDAQGFEYVLPRRPLDNFGEVARPEIGTEYVVEYAQRWLVSNGYFTEAEIYGGGLRIYTTLDFALQEAAVSAITSTLYLPEDPAASIVAIDERGDIRAMVGGLDYSSSQVNLAVGNEGGGSGRQPGSSFKPIVLAEALKQGMPLEKTYESPGKMTLEGADSGEDWVVGNYADAGQGTLNLVDATRVSSNTAYAQLMLEVGVPNVVALAENMGIEAELPEVPSLVLGTGNLSVLDMASAYSTFANRGEHIGPFMVSKVTDAEGRVLWEPDRQPRRVLPEEVADTVNWVLRQVVENGTGKGARITQTAAGKTGTTENYRDAWFVGYTCRMTAAVWMGYPDTERYMEDVHGKKVAGGTFPAAIWKTFMSQATQGLEDCPFERPGAVSEQLDTTPQATSTPTTRSPSTSTPPVTGTTPSTTSAPTSSLPASSTTTTTAAPTTTQAPPTTAPPPPSTIQTSPSSEAAVPP